MSFGHGFPDHCDAVPDVVRIAQAVPTVGRGNIRIDAALHPDPCQPHLQLYIRQTNSIKDALKETGASFLRWIHPENGIVLGEWWREKGTVNGIRKASALLTPKRRNDTRKKIGTLLDFFGEKTGSEKEKALQREGKSSTDENRG